MNYGLTKLVIWIHLSNNQFELTPSNVHDTVKMVFASIVETTTLSWDVLVQVCGNKK